MMTTRWLRRFLGDLVAWILVGPYWVVWKFVSVQFNAPVFVVCTPLHFIMYRNVIKHLKDYKIVVIGKVANDYIGREGVIVETKFLFPKCIVAADFLSVAHNYSPDYPLWLRIALKLSSVKKVQVFHGVIDKNWTFSNANKGYDLLLVAGQYARDRLIRLGLDASTVRITGYPKLDHIIGNTMKVSTSSHGRKTVLYAPTWGLLSSLPYMMEVLLNLDKKYRLIIKLHDHTEWYYRDFLANLHLTVGLDPDITNYFEKADILVSDVSSSMFEFLVTAKPVVALDFNLWMKDFPTTVISTNGPEYKYRDVFYRVASVDRVESVVQRALTKGVKDKMQMDKILNKIFMLKADSGLRMASEITDIITG